MAKLFLPPPFPSIFGSNVFNSSDASIPLFLDEAIISCFSVTLTSAAMAGLFSFSFIISDALSINCCLSTNSN